MSDKLPWHLGFVCNISADRIMTAVMDDITGAVQRSPERGKPGGGERGQG